MNLKEILAFAAKNRASDVHIKSGIPPILRIGNKLHPVPNAPKFSKEIILNMALSIMNDHQKKRFKEDLQVDLAFHIPNVCRARINAYRQQGTTAMVFRIIPYKIPSIAELNLPPIINKIAGAKRGLILVTGATGSGKSTTLASMINYINETRTNNVITIEDPIEYIHQDKKSIISQREIGFDTPSFPIALNGALRQDPDVILVGEMRDLETIETALTAAETGHLVMSALHTLDVTETINRIISVFPPYYEQQIRIQLAGIIKGIISQRLIPRQDGKGMVPAVEVMVGTSRTREYMHDKEKTGQLIEAISQGYSTYGMQSFDQSITDLLKNKLISYEEALRQSTNPADFALKLSGISNDADVDGRGSDSFG
ncbi:MAG: type IV pilus twitching motility protein PilT [Desulfuromonadales bacterium]|nr:type IV pilus twitching motility protein PilT [Desulfuromonadales bacterium]